MVTSDICQYWNNKRMSDERINLLIEKVNKWYKVNEIVDVKKLKKVCYFIS